MPVCAHILQVCGDFEEYKKIKICSFYVQDIVLRLDLFQTRNYAHPLQREAHLSCKIDFLFCCPAQ